LAVPVEQGFNRHSQPKLVERSPAQLGNDRAQISDLLLDVLDSLAHRTLGPWQIVEAQRGGEQHS
jgi:hypothetical protein